MFSFIRRRQSPPATDGAADAAPPASLGERLQRTGSRFRRGLLSALTGRQQLDEDTLELLENELLMADVGVPTTQAIVGALSKASITEADGGARGVLRRVLLEQLHGVSQPLEIPDSEQPFVILVVGVNGSGKTTTIGKLARQLQLGGQSVMLAAGDTFRAAAVEQLQTWGERNRVPVIAQGTGADSASVIYDALASARARGTDVLIADTAGRLQTQSNLMDELAKVLRVMAKLDPAAPHEVLLVLDGSTGQNALSQARLFAETARVSGIALTKLDGTAKGGVVFAIARELGLPVRFIGVGEDIEDLRPFVAEDFVDALLEDRDA